MSEIRFVYIHVPTYKFINPTNYIDLVYIHVPTYKFINHTYNTKNLSLLYKNTNLSVIN
jgi:hypothetical protein